MMHPLRISGIIILAIMCASCGSPSLSSVQQTPGVSPSQITYHSLSNNQVTFFPGGAYNQNTITDDDVICGRMVTEGSSGNQVATAVGLISIKTGEVSSLQALPSQYYLGSCSVTGDWIIWTQYRDTPTMQWQLKAINRKTKQILILDTSQENQPSQFKPTPSSDHGIVVWASINDAGKTVVMSYDFATNVRSLLKENGSMPLISWPWISWGDIDEHGIVFKNMTTQEMDVLHSPPITTSALNNGAFVVSNADYSSISLYPSIGKEMDTGAEVVGTASSGDFVDFPTVNNRLVTWGSNHSLFLFDRKSHTKMMVLNNLNGNPSPFISSHYMVWVEQEANNKYVLGVIDSDLLP